jgi:hypothetical protein
VSTALIITLSNSLSSSLRSVFYPFYFFGVFVATKIKILVTIVKKIIIKLLKTAEMLLIQLKTSAFGRKHNFMALIWFYAKLCAHVVLTVGFSINDRSYPVRLEAIWTSADKLKTGDHSKKLSVTVVASYNYVHFYPIIVEGLLRK